jgi:hypothetical protein
MRSARKAPSGTSCQPEPFEFPCGRGEESSGFSGRLQEFGWEAEEAGGLRELGLMEVDASWQGAPS